MKSDIDEFAERVRVWARLPVPIWATGTRLSSGTPIEIVLHGHEKVVPAKALGQYERGKHVVWHTDEKGRKWRLRLPSSDVIVGYEK